MAENQQLTSLKQFSRLLDSRFTLPGTKFRFGLDGIIGLIPVAGDLFTAVVGSFLMLSALRFKVSAWVMLQMGMNLLLDLAIGAIPLVGDLLDFGFKSHNRNMELIESWVDNPESTDQKSRVSVMASVAAAILILILIISFGIYLLYTLGVLIFQLSGNLIGAI